MIISCSRRTDIPALYADWFYTRVREGYACVRNPMNPFAGQQGSPHAGRGRRLCVLDQEPRADDFPRLDELKDYAYYFQFTLTPYGKDIEPNLPVKIKLMSTFRRLADEIGPRRVIWRYDPILINPDWTVETHLRTFETMARLLSGATHKVTISFLDMDYRNVRRNAALLKAQTLTVREKLSLAGKLNQIARACGMEIERLRFGYRLLRLRRFARALRGRRLV